MAQPAFEAAGTYLTGSGTSAAVAVPSGVANGKIVIVTIFINSGTAAITPAAGFAPAEGSPSAITAGGGNHALHVFWKRATAADAGTYTFSWTGSIVREAIATLYNNCVASGNPFDSPTSTAQDTGSGSVTPAVNVTTAGPDRRLIWAATNWAGGTWTAPTSFTRRAQGGNGNFTTCDAPFPTQGASGNVTGSATGSDKRCAWLGALIGTTSGAPDRPPPQMSQYGSYF
ncbi:hypothetical protein [Acrocarpospora catenulata]|uniref:hypothetical protein n=1 Tax=Acrocarpospora catenulata TaxID=2836182 RepID=UPI001BD9C768|nr:hypothetical protein [Acrocarpospora catenulata]